MKEPLNSPFFTYRAQVEDVIDGDTVDLIIDLGFKTYNRQRVRLGGVDTAEVFGIDQDSEEYEKGKKHANFVEEWVRMARETDENQGWPFLIVTRRDRTGKYGRYLADIYRRDLGSSLSDDLIAEFPDVAR